MSLDPPPFTCVFMPCLSQPLVSLYTKYLLLLSFGSEVAYQTAICDMGSRALLKAVSAGRPRQVRLLLDSGVDPNDTDDLGQTPVIRAIFIEQPKNREKIVRMLLKRGAVVSQADVVGRSALLWACLYGRETEVSLLLEYADLELDLNRSDINGQTALFHAACSGNAAVVKMMVHAMIKYELSVDVPDYCGITPLMQTIRLGFDICASILIHHGKARTGLGARYPEDFIKAEMWAVKAQRKREAEIRSVTAFPPILSQASKNKLRYRENRAARSRLIMSAKSPDCSDDEFSVTDNVTEKHVLDSQINSCLGIQPRQDVPPSILAISPSSSSESLDGSDSDDVDWFSFPEMENKAAFFSTKELHKLYSVHQQQASPSYRKGAPIRTAEMFVKETASSSETTIDSKRGELHVSKNVRLL